MYKKAGRMVGGCSAFLIVGSIGSAYGFISGNDWFVLVEITLTLIGVWLGGVLFVLFERAVNPGLDLEIRLAERRKVASKKGIREAAAAVVNFLGREGKFRDNVLDIQFDRQGDNTKAVIRGLQGGQWQIVFEGTRQRGSSSSTKRTVLTPLESGGFELREAHDGSSDPDLLSVEGYISGQWEAHLKVLERKAKQVANARREDAYKADLRNAEARREEERRRFGL